MSKVTRYTSEFREEAVKIAQLNNQPLTVTAQYTSVWDTLFVRHPCIFEMGHWLPPNRSYWWKQVHDTFSSQNP